MVLILPSGEFFFSLAIENYFFVLCCMHMWCTAGFRFRLWFIFPLSYILYNFYADNIQLYLPKKPDENISLQSLFGCFWVKVKSWMADNFLQLNDSKMDVFLWGLKVLTSSQNPLVLWLTVLVLMQGIWVSLFDFALEFDKQINSAK